MPIFKGNGDNPDMSKRTTSTVPIPEKSSLKTKRSRSLPTTVSSAVSVKITSVKTLLSRNYSPTRRYEGAGRPGQRGRSQYQDGSALKSSPDPKGKRPVGSLEIKQRSENYVVNGRSPEVVCDVTNVHSASSSSTGTYSEAEVYPLQAQYAKLSIDSDGGIKSTCMQGDTSSECATVSICSDEVKSILLHDDGDTSSSEKTLSEDLPLLQDLVDSVLGRLPMFDVLRLRPELGRAFRNAIHRPAFRANRPDSEGEYSPGFFMTDSKGDMHWHGFDTHLRKWSRLPSLNFAKPTLPPDPDLFKDYLIAGDGGLLCINVGKASGREKLVVCNPLTQQVKVLPPLIYPRHPVLMHLKVDHDTGNYKVAVAGSASIGTNELSLKTEEYDSRSGLWKCPDGSDLPCPPFGLNEYQNGVYFKDSERELLMCVAIIDTRGRGVLVYDITNKNWARGPHVPLMRGQVNDVAQLVTSQLVAQPDGFVYVFSEQECDSNVYFLIHKLIPDVSVDFTWEEVMKRKRTNGRELLVYPEFTCVPVSEHELCLFNTVDHTMEMIDLNDSTVRIPVAGPTLNGNRFHSLNPIGFVFKPSFRSVVCPRGRDVRSPCDLKLREYCSECEKRGSDLFASTANIGPKVITFADEVRFTASPKEPNAAVIRLVESGGSEEAIFEETGRFLEEVHNFLADLPLP